MFEGAAMVIVTLPGRGDDDEAVGRVGERGRLACEAVQGGTCKLVDTSLFTSYNKLVM